MLNFHIKTFGCQMNVNDSEKMRAILEKKNFLSADNDKDAEVIIINSCAVRQKAQEKIFSYIGRVDPEKKIIVAGCVAQSEKEKILVKNSRVDFVVGTHQYFKIDGIINELIKNKEKGVKVEFTRGWIETVPAITARESQVSGYISIMEGCDNFCSYCIVPFTRGREKHRSLEKIIKEAEYLSERGYQEIILLGQNVNNWQDKKNNLKFPDLLRILAEDIDIRWIRFITSYPGYYDDELIEVMAKNENIARHIHFPAQSGSTRILNKMKRSYSRVQYLQIIRKFRRAIPEIKFSSDFIVGFPTESDHDFDLTMSFIRQVEYESIFSFIYSPRQHTRAGLLVDNIPLKVKKQRLYQLQNIQNQIQLENNNKLIGKMVEVLVTGKNPKKKGEVIGRTESYRVVNFQSASQMGKFKQVLINSAGPHSLRGREV